MPLEIRALFWGFTNNATPLNLSNPHVDISCSTKPKYAIYIDGHKFERGTYKRVSNSTFTLKDTDGKESGVVFLSNNGCYLYHSKLKGLTPIEYRKLVLS